MNSCALFAAFSLKVCISNLSSTTSLMFPCCIFFLSAALLLAALCAFLRSCPASFSLSALSLAAASSASFAAFTSASTLSSNSPSPFFERPGRLFLFFFTDRLASCSACCCSFAFSSATFEMTSSGPSSSLLTGSHAFSLLLFLADLALSVTAISGIL
ncbi:unnamed protein product [Chrysoparadoxa australica]